MNQNHLAMKKVINGKVYNTETAKEIPNYYSNPNGSSFQDYDESLYLTKKGNWFLYGSGGPLSPYAVTYQGGSSGGSDIIPYTHDEAFTWLEKHNELDAIEMYFSDKIEEA